MYTPSIYLKLCFNHKNEKNEKYIFKIKFTHARIYNIFNQLYIFVYEVRSLNFNAFFLRLVKIKLYAHIDPLSFLFV